MGTYVRDAPARTGEPRAPNACADGPGRRSPGTLACRGERSATGSRGGHLAASGRDRAVGSAARPRTASRAWPIPTSTFSASSWATAASRHIRGVFRLRVVLDAAYPSIVDQAAQAIQQVRPRNTLGRRRREYNDIEIPSYSKAWPCLLPQHGPGRSANDASSSSRGSWISPALCRACSFVGSSTPTGADSSTPGATNGARRGMHSAVSRPTSERSSPTPAPARRAPDHLWLDGLRVGQGRRRDARCARL